MALTICDAIEWWSKEQPETVALSLGGDEVSYAQLAAWANSIAGKLISEGIVTGDRVGICSTNSLAYCALLVGIMRAGGIAVPLNFRYTAPEVEELVEDTTPAVVYTTAEYEELFSGTSVPVQSLSEIEALRNLSQPPVTRELDPDNKVVIIATSGSTAKPKGVVFSHRSMVSYASEFAVQEAECLKGSSVIVVAPLNTSAGFVQLVHYTVLGCTLYFEPTFDPDVFLNVLVERKVTGFGGAPVFFELISRSAGFADADLSNLKIATVGGAPVTRVLQDTWAQKGIVLRQIYGQTEAGGNATIMPQRLAAAAPEKCGRGSMFTQLRTIRDNGEDCAPGEIGQILVRGPGRMIEYWNNPEATAATIRDGWLYTGDLGVLDEYGLLTFVDRMKDIIISGGLNISAAEVERAVASFPNVLEVMVIAAADEKFGETPMAIVHAAEEISVPALIEHCNERLANYKVPRYVAVEAEPLPRTATGKLAKPAMREKYADAPNRLPKVR